MGEVQVTRRRRRRTSLFWPMMLIGIGTIWLLTNIGVFKAENIIVLARLWPLLLIVAGLDLLFGRSSPNLGAIIGIGAVVGLLLLMLAGPSLGWGGDAELQTASYSEAVGEAESAHIELGSGVNDIRVSALPESGDLFAADILYYGEIEYSAEGGTEKTIKLEQNDAAYDGFASFLLDIFGGNQGNEESDTDWNIELSPYVPLDLKVNAGVGNSNLDLADLQLSGLDVDAGVGNVDVTLPGAEESYHVEINGGVGDITITLPEGVAVQVDAEVGVGSLNLPSGLQRVSGDDDSFVGDEGVWETEGFDNAEVQITIRFDGGVGNLTVR